MSDGHIWFSLLSRPTRSKFTRVQRLSACLALLFSSMIASAMWYKTEEAVEGAQNVHIGPFNFSPQQLYISIASSVVSVPVSILIIALFRKAAAKPKKQTSTSNNPYSTPSTPTPATNEEVKQAPARKQEWQEFDELLNGRYSRLSPTPIPASRAEDTYHHGAIYPKPPAPKKKKKPFMLPWWCVYVAWVLVALTVTLSAFFTILYSFEWGGNKSSAWLTSFFLSFIQSVLFIQPIKVGTHLDFVSDLCEESCTSAILCNYMYLY